MRNKVVSGMMTMLVLTKKRAFFDIYNTVKTPFLQLYIELHLTFLHNYSLDVPPFAVLQMEEIYII